jgi:hypothetical protein
VQAIQTWCAAPGVRPTGGAGVVTSGAGLAQQGKRDGPNLKWLAQIACFLFPIFSFLFYFLFQIHI